MKMRIGQVSLGVGLFLMSAQGWAARSPKTVSGSSSAPVAGAGATATAATLHDRELARARLDKHLAMAGFVAELSKHPDVTLLRELHGAASIELHAARSGEKLHLALGAGTLHLAGKAQPATFADLIRMEVTTPDGLTDLLEQRLLKDAGHSAKKPLHAEHATALALARGTAQQQIAAREKFMTVWGNNARHGASNPDIALLSDYAKSIGRGTATVVFPDKTEVTLGYWSPGFAPSLRSKQGDVNGAVFQAMGFATPEAVQEVFSASLLRTAGVGGSPTDPRALRRAREVLRARMKEAAYMEPYLSEAASHRDVARLAATKALFSGSGQQPAMAVIVENASASIGAVAGTDALQYVDRTSGVARAATFSDLLRFEIYSYDAYDTAIGVAMTKMLDHDLAGEVGAHEGDEPSAVVNDARDARVSACRVETRRRPS